MSRGDDDSTLRLSSDDYRCERYIRRLVGSERDGVGIRFVVGRGPTGDRTNSRGTGPLVAESWVKFRNAKFKMQNGRHRQGVSSFVRSISPSERRATALLGSASVSLSRSNRKPKSNTFVTKAIRSPDSSAPLLSRRRLAASDQPLSNFSLLSNSEFILNFES